MNKRKIFILLEVAILLAAVISGCQSSEPTQPLTDVTQAARSAAATAQAELNQLQNEAYLLEQDLDANFSDHYVGIQVESYPALKVIVYLTGANETDLVGFIDDPRLLDVIEVKEEVTSRKELRETRDRLMAEMDEAGITYTTGIKMEPARVLVYVYDLPGAQNLLKAAGVAVPGHVEFIETDTLPEDG